jgi:hypothetical protein
MIFHLAPLVFALALGTTIFRKLSLPVFRIIAVFSRDDDRRQYALEILRLARRDAASIPSYLGQTQPRAHDRRVSHHPRKRPGSENSSQRSRRHGLRGHYARVNNRVGRA